jgi:hypothetical protein
VEDHLTPHERSRPHPAPVDSANYFSSITQKHHLAKTFYFSTINVVFAASQFLHILLANFPIFFLGFVGFALAPSDGSERPAHQPGELFVLFCGAARRKKKEKNKKRIFLFVNSTRCNFRAVNAEEPEHHGQVLKEEEENKFKTGRVF